MNKELRKIGINQLEDFQRVSSSWNYSDSFYLQLINSEMQSLATIKESVEDFHNWSVQLLDSYHGITKEFIPTNMLVGSSPINADSTKQPGERQLPVDIRPQQTSRTSRFFDNVQEGDNSRASTPLVQLQEKPISSSGKTEGLNDNSITTDSQVKSKPQTRLDRDHSSGIDGTESAAAFQTISSPVQPSALAFKSVGNLGTFVDAYQAQTSSGSEIKTAANETTKDSAFSGSQWSEEINPLKSTEEIKSAPQRKLNQAPIVVLPNTNHDSLTPVLGDTEIIDQLLTELSEKIRKDYLRFYSD